MSASESWPWWRKADELRKERGISRRHIARALDRDPGNVDRWMTGGSTPTDATFVPDLAEYLGVSVTYLTNGQKPGSGAETSDALEEASRSLSPGARRLVGALKDPATVQYLIGALDLLERDRRARGQEGRPE